MVLFYSANTTDNCNLAVDFVPSFEFHFPQMSGEGEKKRKKKRGKFLLHGKMPEGKELNSALTCKGRF